MCVLFLWCWLVPAHARLGLSAVPLSNQVEARRRLAVFGCVAFSGIVSKEHCRDMRRDMWQHVEQIAPGFSREDPSTWEHWKKRGNYGMPGKKTIFTAPFLQLRQSRRLAACFGTLMQERPEDLIVSHDRWLL